MSPWPWVLYPLLMLALAACAETPAPEVRGITIELGSCLGPADSACRGRLDEVVPAAPRNGCLVVAPADGAPITRFPTRWAAGQLSLADGTQLAVAEGVELEAALFLFDRPAICELLMPGAGCGAVPGCVLKLRSTGWAARGGARFSFADADNICSADQAGPLKDIERCDGVDQDCDGRADEEFAEALMAACTVGVGACEAAGVGQCAPDGLSVVCSGQPGSPSGEVCGATGPSGVDEDCDGRVDEGLDCVPVVACRTDDDCRSTLDTPICVEGSCLPCDPATHEGCGLDSLCCGVDGQPTCIPAALDSCDGCGLRCGPGADRCVDRTCACGDGPACDEPGVSCVAGRCGECVRDADCPAERAICDPERRQCRACESDLECPDGLPCVARPPSALDGGQVCLECEVGSDRGCDPQSAAPICVDVGDGATTCVACVDPGDCVDPARPICDPQTGRCRGCSADVECGGATPLCVNGACVECAGRDDCADPVRPVCDDETGRCRGCVAAADCDEAAPICSATGACVVCSPRDHSGCSANDGTPFCSEDAGCVECLVSEHCGPGGRCAEGRCLCDPDEPDACGAAESCCLIAGEHRCVAQGAMGCERCDGVDEDADGQVDERIGHCAVEMANQAVVGLLGCHAIADRSADGYGDFAVYTLGSVRIFEAMFDGLRPAGQINTAVGSGPAWADLDEDGRDELYLAVGDGETTLTRRDRLGLIQGQWPAVAGVVAPGSLAATTGSPYVAVVPYRVADGRGTLHLYRPFGVDGLPREDGPISIGGEDDVLFQGPVQFVPDSGADGLPDLLALTRDADGVTSLTLLVDPPDGPMRTLDPFGASTPQNAFGSPAVVGAILPGAQGVLIGATGEPAASLHTARYPEMQRWARFPRDGGRFGVAMARITAGAGDRDAFLVGDLDPPGSSWISFDEDPRGEPRVAEEWLLDEAAPVCYAVQPRRPDGTWRVLIGDVDGFRVLSVR